MRQISKLSVLISSVADTANNLINTDGGNCVFLDTQNLTLLLLSCNMQFHRILQGVFTPGVQYAACKGSEQMTSRASASCEMSDGRELA